MSHFSYYTQILLDAVRCLVLAGVVTTIGWKIAGRLPRSPGWGGWAIIIAPLCTPALLVSYTYAPIALHLTGTPWLLTLFYSILTALKLMPVVVIARRIFPPSITPEARFCEGLISRRSLTARVAFRLRALGPVPWMTAALFFLFAFTDFELASLLSIKTWTVRLFDAHTGGLNLKGSLEWVAVPAAVELLTILLLVRFARRIDSNATLVSERGSRSRWALPLLGGVCAVASGWPLVRVIGQSFSGWVVIGMRDTVGEEVLVSVVKALVATLAIGLTFAFVRRWSTRFLIALPGLFGALVVSLVILAVLNAPPPDILANQRLRTNWNTAFNVLAESPVPLICAEAVLLAPVAVLLWLMLARQKPGEKLHLARMAGSRRLIWDLAVEPRAAAFGLLFLLGYFEFTAASILAPVQLTPVFVRLHNLAHYGQTAALSAMLVAAMLAPVVVLALTLGGARFYARRNVR